MRKSSKHSVFHITMFFLLLAFLGCAPVISKQVRKQVNPDITIEEIFRDPEHYKGEVIIVSGDIIETEVTKEGSLLKAIQHPAGFRGRPKDVDKTEGRFLAIADFYLDPYVYSRGREVTIGGEVEGTRSLPLGEMQYDYPTIRIKEIYLWPIERIYYPLYRPHYYYDYWWWRSRYW